MPFRHLPPVPRSLTLLATALLLLAVVPSPALAGDDAVPDAPTVVVSGDGEVRTAPDEATVRLGVTAQADTAGDAQEQVNATASAVLQAVRAAGVDEQAVQTSRLSLFPVYDQRPRRGVDGGEGEPEIVGYRASNVVAVRVEELERIGPVVDAAVRAGANEVQGVDFQLRDDAGPRREALKRAVAEARAKAEAMAEALGLRLGEVLEADEGGVNVRLPQLGRTAVRMEAAMGGAPTPVAPGDVTVSAGVTLRYRLLAAE